MTSNTADENSSVSYSMTDKFIAYLTGQVGRGIYVWGAQGQRASEEFIKKHETSEKNIERALELYHKRIGDGIEPLAFDCSGLIVRFFLDEGLLESDRSSRGLYATSQPIDRDELIAGDLVFRHNGEKIFHVGVYVGDDEVIEAKGRSDGVVKRHIDASGENYWNRCARFCPLFELSKRDLRLTSPYMRGQDVALMQEQLLCLGYDLGKKGQDGIFGKCTDAAVRLFKKRAAKCAEDGVCDYNMRTLLGI